MLQEGDSEVTAAPDGADAPEAALIAAEIQALHKGRGIGVSDLHKRAGPKLRELGGAASPETGASANPAEFRAALSAVLGRCASRLPDDLRTAALASLGLAPGTTHMPHFGDRVTWLAERIGRNYRTALRRVDDAEDLLAEEVVKELGRRRGRQGATDGWYLDEFRAVLRLDGESPEAHEHRRIIAVQPGLAEVAVSLDVPRDHDQAQTKPLAEVVFGGTLVRREEPTPTRTHFVVRLPAPLQPGQRHDFEIIVRIPSANLMRPHYIFTPERECNSFDLRVRFHPQRVPAWVRLVDGETVRTFDETRPGIQQVTVDSTGEARAAFTKPARYLGYGLQWQAP